MLIKPYQGVGRNSAGAVVVNVSFAGMDDHVKLDRRSNNACDVEDERNERQCQEMIWDQLSSPGEEENGPGEDLR